MINSLEGLSLPELYRLRENINNEIIKRKMLGNEYNPLNQNNSPKNEFSNDNDKILKTSVKKPSKRSKSVKKGKTLVVIGGHRRVWACNNCHNIVSENQEFCDECGIFLKSEEDEG